MIGQRLPSPISFLPIAAAIENSGLMAVNLYSSILEGVVAKWMLVGTLGLTKHQGALHRISHVLCCNSGLCVGTWKKKKKISNPPYMSMRIGKKCEFEAHPHPEF